MRVDGSIKSLITGLSTVDKSRSKDVKYMRACLNFRNDTIDGLSRRPPTDLVNDRLEYVPQGVIGNPTPTPVVLDGFNINTDVMKAFTVGGDRYWFYSKSDPDGLSIIQVYDEDGNIVTTDRQGGTYLNGTTGNDSIRLASSGDTTYIVNTAVTVEVIEGSTPIEDNHSMFVVREAPKVYSTIVVRWEYPDYTQGVISYEVGEDHFAQPIQDISDVDTGVNTTCGLIADKINAQIILDSQTTNLELDQEGATIVFRNISASNTRQYSRVVVEDGTGGAVMAINGTVEDITQLPRYSHANALIEIKPDPTTNRGKFYMRSASVLTLHLLQY